METNCEREEFILCTQTIGFTEDKCKNCIRNEVGKLRKIFEALPKRKKYSLGSKGVEILNKIHRIEMKKRLKDDLD